MGAEQAVAVWQLSDGELLAGLLDSERALRKQYGRTLELIAEAETRGVAVAQGYRDTAALLAMALRITRAEATARVAQATTPMPLVENALRAGDIGHGHVREIQKVLAQAPETLAEADRVAAEDTLVELAQRANPKDVARAGRRLLTYWDLDDTPPKDRERSQAEPYREFRGHYRRDGQYAFSGELDPEAAAEFEGMLQPLAKPQPADPDGLPDPRTTAHRHGDALAEIIALAARCDALPSTGGERAVVTVTVSLAELQHRAGTALLDTPGYTTITQLRRWCCEAKVLPAVLGSQGEVLDLGRATRLATPAQRRALAIRDQGCIRPGCTRGPKWCQAHHVVSWLDGGSSDMDNMVLLCARHHREIHHTQWSVRIRHGTPEFIPPTWLDPEQKPIRNTRPHVNSPRRRSPRLTPCSSGSTARSAAAKPRQHTSSGDGCPAASSATPNTSASACIG